MGFAQRYSKDAEEYLSALVLNKPIEIRSHGYLNSELMLGMFFLEGRNIILEMVRAGLAGAHRWKAAKGPSFDSFIQAEMQSKAKKRRMWTQGDGYVSPGAWRKRQRLRAVCKRSFWYL